MSVTPMMQCGHAANAQRIHSDGTRTPSCAICAGITPGANIIAVTPPDLAGRQARCHCGTLRPSDPTALAFFEYRGPNAPNLICGVGRCHFLQSVHQPINPTTGREGITDHAYVAREYEFDSFYCGCDGWD